MLAILPRFSCVSCSMFIKAKHMSMFSKYVPKVISKRMKLNVAVINLFGKIQPNLEGRQFGGSKKLNLESVDKSIEKAFSVRKLTEVCLLVNSPGGSPVQSELIANKIIKLSRDKNIKVVSFIEDVAASGGYWLACAGKEIYVSENSVVGSIGATMQTLGFHELIKQYGIERRVYTAGKNKSMLDPFLPEKEEDVVLFQNILNSIHLNFKNYVKEQRGNRLNANDDTLFEGEVWVGRKAVELGLVDGIDYLDNYIDKKFGANNVNIVRVNPQNHTGLLSRFSTKLPMLDDLVFQDKFKFL